MVDDSVHDRYRDVVVEEELMPAGEVLVGGDDQRTVFIHGVNELEQVVHATLVHWQVSELIDDYDVELRQLG